METGTIVPFSEEQLKQIAGWIKEHPTINAVPTSETRAASIETFLKSCSFPVIVVSFGGPTEILYNIRFSNNVQGSQLELTGHELIAMAEIIRNKRLSSQLIVQQAPTAGA